jgi:DNA-binding transcriptional LysR family regulator
MALELNQLRHLLALAQHGSFVRAAKSLHMSQPALSRSIQTLEQHLGTPLFLRSASGAVPTDLGRLYIARARDVVRMADELDRDLQDRRTIQSGHVAAGGGPFPVELLLARAAERFIQQYPSISMQIVSRNWDDLLRLLRSRDLDFFVGEVSTLAHEPDVVVEHLAEKHPLFFIARSGHPLAGRNDVSAAEVFAWPFLTPSRLPPRIYEPMLAVQREVARSGATTRPLPILECSSLATLQRLLDVTDSLSAAPLPLIAGDLQRKRYVVLGTEPWLYLHYGLVSLKGRPITQAATRFREYVREAEQEFSAEDRRLVAELRKRGTRRQAKRTGTR